MIKNLQEKDYVYIPGGENQEAVSNLITNLNIKTLQLENDYKNKINNIQDTIYSHQKDDIKLENIFQNQKNLENQESMKFYKEYQKKQNNEIKRLTNQSDELQKNFINNTQDIPDTQNYNSIKSSFGQHLSLTPIKNSYMINVNQNCLFVNKNNEYSLKKCNNNSIGQRFQLTTIHDDLSYFKEFNQEPTQETKNQYPFNIVKSNISKECLTDNKDGISVNQCKSLEGQKWFGLRNTKQKCF